METPTQYLQQHISLRHRYQTLFWTVVDTLEAYRCCIRSVSYNAAGQVDYDFASEVQHFLDTIPMSSDSLQAKMAQLEHYSLRLQRKIDSLSHMEMYCDIRWRNSCDI